MSVARVAGYGMGGRGQIVRDGCCSYLPPGRGAP